eukprot:CAMPEP_0119106562 /NCGR_PEP_ID=MMETSP1180-20130426/4870_1 /TAXON_ID=3052 ORGANISM="Chlamydomonas cf sp, Strain CCMP681" /NCGR_SAMPLE_ID=MMETSP1180 /ASSEMBLY_ACC=CAM_ASM_000741 /LENGTH=184 /DNA_ID=CAMNT_0007091925 /DNA_START=44 /DNA_END=598 /DNA_ORIENTATION=+
MLSSSATHKAMASRCPCQRNIQMMTPRARTRLSHVASSDTSRSQVAVSAAAVELSVPAEQLASSTQDIQDTTPVLIAPWEFDSFMAAAGGQLVVVDFYTEWCGPCKLMNKEFEKLSRAFPGTVQFAKLNVGVPGAHREFATEKKIRVLPTFQLYHNGKQLDQVTGAKPLKLRQMLNEAVFQFRQ